MGRLSSPKISVRAVRAVRGRGDGRLVRKSYSIPIATYFLAWMAHHMVGA